MARGLAQAGVEIEVVTTKDAGPGMHTDVALEQAIVRDGVTYRYFQKQTDFYKVSWPFRSWIRAHVMDFDIVHVHALFSFTSVVAARAASRDQVPFVIRPLGVLNQWGMRHRRPWLKSLSFRFIEQPLLRRAAAVHYTSDQELREAVRAGVPVRRCAGASVESVESVRRCVDAPLIADSRFQIAEPTSNPWFQRFIISAF
jgi:hypothetical protein